MRVLRPKKELIEIENEFRGERYNKTHAARH